MVEKLTETANHATFPQRVSTLSSVRQSGATNHHSPGLETFVLAFSVSKTLSILDEFLCLECGILEVYDLALED